MPRLIRTSLARWIDPAAVFEAVCGNGTDAFWLDSGPGATTGRSYIGRASRVVTSGSVDSVLEFLRSELTAHPAQPLESDSAGFALGWVGWLGYESRFETMGVARDRVSPYPDAAFLYVDQAIEFDHATRRVTVLSFADPAELVSSLEQVLASAKSDTVRRMPGAPVASVAVWRDSDNEYLELIHECQRRIAVGEAYQLCLTTEVHVDVHPEPLETYLALRLANPSHHGALIRVGDVSMLSSSPERFLSVSPSGRIQSRPIKGTRRRGATGAEDATLAAELLASEKERAENLMIVDLMRNDIGRVSEVGSVTVPTLLEVETYASVHQLVSTVEGQLEQGRSPVDAVIACFPAGSMTGTPKSSATRILDGLEGHPRGIYAGAFGYFGLDGRIDLAMTIRTIVLSQGGASIGTGGGITALSDPDDELAEIKLKADALLRVLGAAN
jgi:para-aminobenzoate synthetase component I